MRTVRSMVVCLLVLMGAVGGTAGAQDLRPLGSDITTLLSGIGESLLPNMQQNLLADDGIGAASMGSSHFFVGLEGGVTFGSPGLLAVLTETPTPFQLIDVGGLVKNLGSDPTVGGYLTTLENLSYFPYPEGKLVVGVKPAFGIEVVGTFFILPQALTNLATGLAGLSNSGIEFNNLGATVHIRKVLIEDKGGFPAVSIGVGYAYSNFHASYQLPTQTQSFAGYTLTYGGTLALDASLNSVGIDLSISKRFAIFTPYINIAPWYQWASYSGAITTKDFFSLKDSSGNTPGGLIPPNTPDAEISINNLSFILSGGIEINLGGFALVPAGSFDLGTKNFSANISSRFQF